MYSQPLYLYLPADLGIFDDRRQICGMSSGSQPLILSYEAIARGPSLAAVAEQTVLGRL